MREMVLNHASLLSPDRHAAVERLKGMTTGMLDLRNSGVAQAVLRMSRSVYEIHCMSDWSLWDALLELRRGRARGEFAFFASLVSKVPLPERHRSGCLGSVPRMRGDRVRDEDAIPKDGEPLVLCAITNSITVGFPSEPVWDRDQLTIRFNEMHTDGSIVEVSETIDNLTNPAHARPICERHREVLRRCKNFAELWGNREIAFPHLVFGPDVEVNAADLQTVVNKLASLDDAAAKWRDTGGAAPPWMSKVTPESDSVMNNERLREARRFRSHHGRPELFEWHARFGSGGRIHLRFDPRTYEVEIGYIGKKLGT